MPEAQDANGTSVATHLARSGIDTDSWVSCQTFETTKALALAGLPAILPSRVAHGGGATSALVPVPTASLPPAFGPHEIGFSYLRRRSCDVAVRRIKDIIEHALRQPAPAPQRKRIKAVDRAPRRP